MGIMTINPYTFAQVVSNTPISDSVQKIGVSLNFLTTMPFTLLTSVTSSQTACFFNGQSVQRTLDQALSWAQLTSNTQMTFTRNSFNNDCKIQRMCIVDFISGVISSVQRGTISVGSLQASNTATISSVNTSLTTVHNTGFGVNVASTGTDPRDIPTLELTNATTITAERHAANNGLTVGYEAIEWSSTYVNSVQFIEITNDTNDKTQTVSSVNTGRSFILYNWFTANSGATTRAYYNTLTLTNSTTVTSSVPVINPSTPITTRGYLIEFKPGYVKSVQQGTVTIAANGTSGTDTLSSSVDTSKSIILFNGINMDVSTNIGWTRVASDLVLTNSTTVTATKFSGWGTAQEVAYTVVEFY